MGSGWGKVRRNSAEMKRNRPKSLGESALLCLYFLDPFRGVYPAKWEGLQEEANALGCGSPRQPTEDPLHPPQKVDVARPRKTRLYPAAVVPSSLDSAQLSGHLLGSEEGLEAEGRD